LTPPEDKGKPRLVHDADAHPEEYRPTYLDLEALEENGDPPPRDWALNHWLGMGHVTLLAAKGGMGKSIFVQQLATALAIQRDFISRVPKPRRVLLWMGEDDDDELSRRQKAISIKFDIPVSFTHNRLFLESMVDTDCTLLAKVPGAGLVRTGMLKVLREQVGDLKIDVVVLDNAAKMFLISENDRGEVTAAVTSINWACKPTKAAGLLLSHPAKPKDSEYAGSTAWENAARMRWWLTDHPPDKPPAKDDELAEPQTDLRYICKRKVNYSSLDIAVMRYTLLYTCGSDQFGAYDIVTPPSGGIVAAIDRATAKRVVLAAFSKLTAMNIPCSESPGSHNSYLPKLMLQYQLGEGFTKTDLAHAMHDLMVEGVLVRAQVGVYGNRSTPRFGLVMAAKDTKIGLQNPTTEVL
jgi:hypothetical protein